jgi:hypothetical protein
LFDILLYYTFGINCPIGPIPLFVSVGAVIPKLFMPSKVGLGWGKMFIISWMIVPSKELVS